MGIFSTRWEADWEGVKLTVHRNEVTKGFRLESDGRLVDEKRWSWIGTGVLQGTIERNGRSVPVEVQLRVSFPRPKCIVRVDGAEVPVRQVK